jgi:hypothetical protein
MINGNMDLLGVPWEVIVKDFRTENHSKVGTLKQWLDDLIGFASTHKACNPISEQQHVQAIAWDEFETIKRQVSSQIIRSGQQNPNVEQIIAETAKAKAKFYVDAKRAAQLKGITRLQIMDMHGPLLDQIIDDRFSPVAVSNTTKRVLKRVVAAALLSSELSIYSTGLIVAGYGDGDMFPSLATGEVDGAVLQHLKFVPGEHVVVDRVSNRGRVISFAQTDVVERLLSGADARFVQRSAEYFGEALERVRASVTEALTQLGGAPDVAGSVFGEIVAAVRDEYKTKFAKDVAEGFQREFNEMIALMPKQDIIELAEALVSITSIERKASSEQATVGGPVDVAFITRHEGFVWIKRKHYFDPALNPRFFWRKFGNVGSSGGMGYGPSEPA